MSEPIKRPVEADIAMMSNQVVRELRDDIADWHKLVGAIVLQFGKGKLRVFDKYQAMSRGSLRFTEDKANRSTVISYRPDGILLQKDESIELADAKELLREACVEGGMSALEWSRWYERAKAVFNDVTASLRDTRDTLRKKLAASESKCAAVSAALREAMLTRHYCGMEWDTDCNSGTPDLPYERDETLQRWATALGERVYSDWPNTGENKA